MPSLYDNLRTGTVPSLLTKFKTGTVEIGRPVTTPGANEWDPPSTSVTWTEVDAVVTGVPQRMIDGTNIVGDERMVLCQTPTIDEVAGDRMRIDGKQVVIVRVEPKLAAGDPVVTRVVVR
jgi:hypothetical protein